MPFNQLPPLNEDARNNYSCLNNAEFAVQELHRLDKLQSIRTVENNNSIEDKARTKLKEIKNLEIFKLKEKTLKLTQKIETERGRRR